MNLRDFSSGDCFDVYKWLGAQFDGFGTTFRVYAPNAEGVSVIGDFNGWQDWYLNRTGDGKFWEIRITDARPGQMYKYKIYHGGNCVEHCDPVGFGMELRPKFASIIRDMRFDFDDLDWMEKRHTWHGDALNIYEVHLGSWRTDPGDPNGWYKYEDIAPQLVKYCKEHGYNCVELMPLNEYPCDESWGYQATGFFSPTSRYGTAEGLKKLVNTCHKNGIAVLMDYVPVHFAVDGYALAQFDGTPTYESQFKDIAFSEWGSCNFDFTKGPVCSFLKSVANYWLTEYHFDGLRMDAISRVIYYMGDPSRGENVCGVKFLKSLNRGLKWSHPSAILCAEDSTDYPMVTKPVDEGGLGFDYKWDMGWMNDTLNYFRTPPDERVNHYHKLTFSMMYYYSEKYILPLSHDENVHGKATVIQKMYGDYDDKFPQARALYMYMYAHPGKKLLFMGGEFGHFIEWKYDDQLDWFLLLYENHPQVQQCCKRLNEIYRTTPALYQIDDSWDGFQWIQANDSDNSIVAFLRTDKRGNSLLCVTNFTPVFHPQYRIGLPQMGTLTECFNTDRKEYGGSNQYNNWAIRTEEERLQDFQYSCDICVPPLATVYFTYQRDPLPEKAKLLKENAKRKLL